MLTHSLSANTFKAPIEGGRISVYASLNNIERNNKEGENPWLLARELNSILKVYETCDLTVCPASYICRGVLSAETARSSFFSW